MNDLFQLEIEDARELVENMRGDPNAFDFQMYKQHEFNGCIPSRCYNVMVALHEQRVRYKGGCGLDWVGYFEFDLNRGVFGEKFAKEDL